MCNLRHPNLPEIKAKCNIPPTSVVVTRGVSIVVGSWVEVGAVVVSVVSVVVDDVDDVDVSVVEVDGDVVVVDVDVVAVVVLLILDVSSLVFVPPCRKSAPAASPCSDAIKESISAALTPRIKIKRFLSSLASISAK